MRHLVKTCGKSPNGVIEKIASFFFLPDLVQEHLIHDYKVTTCDWIVTYWKHDLAASLLPGIAVECLILFMDMAHFMAVISQTILTTSLGL